MKGTIQGTREQFKQNANQPASGIMLDSSLALPYARKERARAGEKRKQQIKKLKCRLAYRCRKHGAAIDDKIAASLAQKLARLQSGAPTFEIGRASCRERVEIAVGGVAIE